MENHNSLRAEIRARLDHGFKHRDTMQTCERLILEEGLRKHNGNQCATAEYLGMHRNTLGHKLEELGIDPKQFHVKATKIPSVRTYRKLEGIA